MGGNVMGKGRMYFKMMAESLIRRKSRMAVALLAVVVGATLLTGLGSLFLDIPNQMGQEFRSYGANLVFLPDSDEDRISDEAFAGIMDMLPEEALTGVTPYQYSQIKINEQPFMAVGTDFSQTENTSPYWFVTGSRPDAEGETLIGREVSELLRVPAGGQISVTGTDAGGESFSRDFTVSGVLETGGSEEAFVFVSLEDFAGMTGMSGYDVIECSLAMDSGELEALAESISKNVDGVAPRLVQKLTQSEGSVLTKLESLILLVTIVVLVLTLICVATTMMAMVTERRKEIGLRKALGAEDRSIVADFFGEGVVVGLVGGFAGFLCGLAFAWAVGVNVFGRAIEFRPSMLPVTLAAAVLVTIVAGFVPVRSVTQINPAVVLKGE
jgi:putative ABC transport system permease protein